MLGKIVYTKYMLKKLKIKKEVYFIATKLNSNPVSVTFYTKEGQTIPHKTVTKRITTRGTRFFATI